MLRNLKLYVTTTFTIADFYICGPSSCALVQLHHPLPQAYFSTMMSTVSFDSMINVWRTAHRNYIIQINADVASAILALAMHIKKSTNM